mmetsp:Transcript_27675/g.82724  ORF Transcript_27675/g.82724 Transcript_27675/m.82724 type:complete len:217 (-) Transcript_27675:111-761(-)
MRLRIVSSVSPSPPTDRVTSSHASGSSERYAAATCAAPSLCSNQLPGRLARSAISFGRALSAALAAASLAAFFASASARMYSSCFSTHALSRSAASASRASFSASAAASRRDAVIAARCAAAELASCHRAWNAAQPARLTSSPSAALTAAQSSSASSGASAAPLQKSCSKVELALLTSTAACVRPCETGSEAHARGWPQRGGGVLRTSSPARRRGK